MAQARGLQCGEINDKNAVRCVGERHMVVSKVILALFAAGRVERVERVERGHRGWMHLATYSADVEGRLE